MKRYISIILAVAAVLLFNLIVIAEKNIVINSAQTSLRLLKLPAA